MRAWICVLDVPGCYERAARAERKFTLTRLRIGQNCRAVCKKKSGLNASGHRDALSSDWCKSTTHFERPAEQALVLATELQVKQEVSSVLCHTCQ